MFTIVGALLTVYGLLGSDPEVYKRSLGINVNLWWGGVLCIFGVVMLLLGQRGQRRSRERAKSNDPGAPFSKG